MVAFSSTEYNIASLFDQSENHRIVMQLLPSIRITTPKNEAVAVKKSVRFAAPPPPGKKHNNRIQKYCFVSDVRRTHRVTFCNILLFYVILLSMLLFFITQPKSMQIPNLLNEQ